MVSFASFGGTVLNTKGSDSIHDYVVEQKCASLAASYTVYYDKGITWNS